MNTKKILGTIVSFWHIITYKDYLSEYNKHMKHETPYGIVHLTNHSIFKEDNMTKKKVIDNKTLPLPLPLPEHLVIDGEIYTKVIRSSKIQPKMQIKVPPVLIQEIKIQAKDAIIGKSFTVPECGHPEVVYKRIKITGFLWNSHIIQDIHARGNIVALIIATNCIGCIKGTEIIKYVDE